MSRLLLGLKFYLGNARSFSRLGFQRRGLADRPVAADFSGQTWLVSGGSGGIGRAVVDGAARRGARVIAVARSEEKLAALAEQIDAPERVDTVAVDLSLAGEVRELVDTLARDGIRIDVLVNNVGVLLNERRLTAEGFETAFATNLLNHYLLTELLLQRGLMASGALVVEVSSGGMYTAALEPDALNSTGAATHDGVADYARHKRAQVELVRHWTRMHEDAGVTFHVMHPGWVDTAGVRDSLPGFRAVFGSVLRTPEQGADTILWLAADRPPPVAEGIWFDRELRPEHIDGSTRGPARLREVLVHRLEECVTQADHPA